MKWFKHISDSLDDPFIFDLIDQFGADGYLVFFGVIEIYAREFKPEPGWKLSVSKAFLRQKLHKRQDTKIVKCLEYIRTHGKLVTNSQQTRDELVTNSQQTRDELVDNSKKDNQNSGKWDIVFNGEQVIVYIPKFKELIDNWTVRKLQSKDVVAPKKHLLEEEVEEEVRSKNKRYNQKDFDLFYNLYPNKKERKATLARWKILLKSNELPDIDIIISALKKQIEWRENTDDEFVPPWKNPSTWLNKGCWEDEITTKNTKLYTDAKRFLDSGEETFNKYCSLNELNPGEVKKWIETHLK